MKHFVKPLCALIQEIFQNDKFHEILKPLLLYTQNDDYLCGYFHENNHVFMNSLFTKKSRVKFDSEVKRLESKKSSFRIRWKKKKKRPCASAFACCVCVEILF